MAAHPSLPPNEGDPPSLPNASSVLSSVATGSLTGSLCVLFAVTYAGLIFTGPLAEFIAVGIGMSLFGAAAHALIVAWRSSYQGSVSGVVTEIAILGVAISTALASVSSELSATQALASAVAIMTLATLLTGAVYLILGYTRRGNLVRYIPYPVLGGFLAGIGWLLIVGGIELSLGDHGTSTLIETVFEPDHLLRWLPALAIGIALTVLNRITRHFLGVPVVLAAALIGFYLLASYNDVGIETLSASGWLLGPFVEGQSWSPLLLADIASDVPFGVIVSALPGIAVFLVTVVIGLLLVGASMEVVTGTDIELDSELKAAGTSNLLAALAGGFPGYHYIASTTLHHQLGANRRLTGLVCGAVCVFTLLFGFDVLALVPRLVAAALLFVMGATLLSTWLIESYMRLTRTDYLVVWTVFTFVVLLGLMEGVIIGLVLGLALFAFNYSRIDVVRRALTAKTLRSRVSRPTSAVKELRRLGDSVLIYRLDGYIFFGTVNRLLERIRERTATGSAVSGVILDFHNVRGIDSSAAIYFGRLPGLGERRGFDLLVSGVAPQFWQVLKREGFVQERRVALSGAILPGERRDPKRPNSVQRIYSFENLDQAA